MEEAGDGVFKWRVDLFCSKRTNDVTSPETNVSSKLLMMCTPECSGDPKDVAKGYVTIKGVVRQRTLWNLFPGLEDGADTDGLSKAHFTFHIPAVSQRPAREWETSRALWSLCLHVYICKCSFVRTLIPIAPGLETKSTHNTEHLDDKDGVS